jgi:hypothetical protein
MSGFVTTLDKAARSTYRVSFVQLLVRTVYDNFLPFVLLAVIAILTALGAHWLYTGEGLAGFFAQLLASTCQQAHACGDWAYLQGGLAAGLTLTLGAIVVIGLNVLGDMRQMKAQNSVSLAVLGAAQFLAQYELAPQEIQRLMLKRIEDPQPLSPMELREEIAEIRDRQAEQEKWTEAQLAALAVATPPVNGKAPTDAALGIAE